MTKIRNKMKPELSRQNFIGVLIGSLAIGFIVLLLKAITGDLYNII